MHAYTCCCVRARGICMLWLHAAGVVQRVPFRPQAVAGMATHSAMQHVPQPNAKLPCPSLLQPFRFIF